MPRYLGIDHLGVVVEDLAAASSTWRDVLGFTSNGGEELADRGLVVDFIETGNARVELIAPTRPDSEISRHLEKRGQGLHHICVRVDDIVAALAELKAKGARLVDEVPRPGAHDSLVAFVHPKSTHGVLLELVQHKDHAP